MSTYERVITRSPGVGHRPTEAQPATPKSDHRSGSLAVRNGLWSSLASLSGAIAGLIGSIVIVRSLTPEEYGSFSYYLWLASILSTFGVLAFPNALTKIRSELRGEQQKEQAGSLSKLVIGALIIVNGLIAFGIGLRALASEPPERSYQLVVAAALVPFALTAALRSHLWADQRYRPVAIVSILGTAVHLSLIGMAIWRHWHVTGFLTAALALNAVQSVALLAVLSLPFTGLSLSIQIPDLSILRRYLVFAAPAGFVQITDQLIWQRSGIFFLERESTLEQVGYYSLAFTGFSLCLMLGWALVQGFYPAISHDYGAGDWDGIRRRLRQAVILATLYAAPVSLGGLAMLPFLLPLVYGEKVGPSVPVAQVLFLGLLPGVVTAVFGLTISAIGGIGLHVRLGLISATVGVIANLILVPRLGAVGGALANTIAQLTTATLLMGCAHVFYGLSLPWRRAGTILVVGVFSAFLLPLAIHEMVPDESGVMLAVVVAVAAYAVLTWRLGYLRVLFGLRGEAPA